MHVLRLIVILMLFSSGGGSVFAQGTDNIGDFEYRLELTRKIHEVRPVKDQVYAAIDRLAKAQPLAQQERFRSALKRVLNYKAIEQASIDAMAEIYTAQELEAMLDYYSKPEARSAARKTQEYSKRLSPEIMRMLDQAMMKVRTGGL